MKNSKFVRGTKKETKPSQAILLTLRDQGCLHHMILQNVIKTAELQRDHNKEMEKTYSDARQHEKALMQQQYAHGIQHVLNAIKSFQGMHKDGVGIFLYPWKPEKMINCKLRGKLKRAFEAFHRELHS